MKQRSIFSVKLSILQFSILLATKIVAMAMECYKKGQKSWTIVKMFGKLQVCNSMEHDSICI